MDYPTLSERINKSSFIELLSMAIYNTSIRESPTQPAKIPPKTPPRIPDPVTIWKGFPAATHRITPAGVHAIARSPHYAELILPMPQDEKEAACA
jgi:hypothetical protein